MVENPPGEKLSCAPRCSDPSARKHLQTRGRNSATWRSPKRRRRPEPSPCQLARFKVGDPLTGVKRSWDLGKQEERRKQNIGTSRRTRLVEDDPLGFRGALHLKSQVIAKHAAALIRGGKTTVMFSAPLKKTQ